MLEDVAAKKRPHEATSIRIDSSIIHLIARKAREPKRTPKRLEEDSRTDPNIVEASN
jgi:hypothetical protein